jgi:sugar lactone lactonase YvrE
MIHLNYANNQQLMKALGLTFLVFAFATAAYSQQLTFLWETDTTLRVPESVLLDTKRNVLYVANINGKSGEKDGNGFISVLSPNGKITNLKWITGLDAPKGMGLVKNLLYVADLTAVVVIDIDQNKVVQRIEVEGAQFLNDITTSPSGEVYVSDSSTGKIHQVKDQKSTLYFESTDFKRINGLLVLNDGLYVADAGNGVNYKLTNQKALQKITETSQGADGIVMVGKDEYLVSSWGGEVFYVNALGQSQKLLDTREQKLNSADIWFNEKTKVVYIPTFFGNRLMAYSFKK